MKKLDHALALAARGFRVFPLLPGKKIPPKDFAWQERATTDAQLIHTWWQENAQYNIGVAPDAATIVLDADTKGGKAGLASLDLLDAMGLPDTLRVSTPSGGVHVYLKVQHQHRNRVDSIPNFPGIDIRTAGGYVLGPGSVVEKKPYRVVTDAAIGESPNWFEQELLVSLPHHTAAANREPVVELDLPHYVEAAIDYLVNRAPEAVEGSGGDNATFTVAAGVRDYGISEEKCFELLAEHWNESKAFPPWDMEDLQKKVHNAYKHSSAAWGSRAPVKAEHEFEAVDIDIGTSPFAKIDTSPKTHAEWPDPVSLWGDFVPPALPRGLLPKVIEDFAFAQGELMGADPAGFAAAALAVCAGAISDDIAVKVKRHEDWRQPARVWVALVGEPSTKKTPIMRAAMRPLKEIDGTLLKDWAARKAVYDAVDRKERKGLAEPKQMRALLEDVTTESAGELMKENPQGLLLFRDELGGWFGAMDKYSGGRGSAADRGFWLESFNGGSVSVNRIGRGTVYIERLSVSLLGGIQPERIRQVADDAVDDGLLQRLFPIILQSAAMEKDEPVGEAYTAYCDMVRGLRNVLTSPDPDSGICDPEPALLRFTEGAQQVRDSVHARLHEMRWIETVNKKLAAHIAKHDGMFASLCVLWHVVENGPIIPHEITEDTAKRVDEFMQRFLMPHAYAFFAGTLGFSEDQDTLGAIADEILIRPEQEMMTWRDLQRGGRKTRALDADMGRKLLEQMEFFGWVHSVPPKKNQSVPRFKVNPKVHEMYKARATLEAERRVKAREAIAKVAAYKKNPGG